MATIETDVSTNQSVAELVSIRRHLKFTNVLITIGVGSLLVLVNRELMGPVFYGTIITVSACLTMR